MSATNFSSLKLNKALVENLSTLGYKSMTPIQAQSLPHILEGKDIIAQGKTGSGKTAAFGLGLLNNLNVKRFRVQTLVLCPTRELADQVATEIRKLARSIHNIKVLTLCGGSPLGPQIGSLEHGAHIIVGTPGRIEDHLNRGRLNLDDLNTLVLDEADRMLEMGFEPTLNLIFSLCPKQRQTMLFSATFPKEIKPLSEHIMQNPVTVKVTETENTKDIKQHFYSVEGNEERTLATRLLLQKFSPESAVIFCTTKIQTQEVADELHSYGFSTLALHGDLEQRDRDQALIRFSNKSVSVLVATDVAARGLDIDSLDMVINYHISQDPEIHIHRIGRTGRAGSKGIACSLISEKEIHKMIRLEDYLGYEIETETLPSSEILNNPIKKPMMSTLQLDGGKKQKIRPGDILGALTSKSNITGEQEIQGSQVGKIQVFDIKAYVAVHRSITNVAIQKLNEGKLKGRSVKVRCIRG
jgi:ATP-independent RNA helicase DbpA